MPISISQSPIRTTLPWLAALAGIALAMPAAASPRYALTIYEAPDSGPLFDDPGEFEPPPGYAIVLEQRNAQIGAGRGTLTLNGFPRHLDPAALTVTLEHGRVVNQRFEAEAPGGEALLRRNLGRQVTVEQYQGGDPSILTGELLSVELPLALRLDDGSIVSLNDYSRIRLPAPGTAPSGLPQLRLGVEAEQAGLQLITLSYPTAGIAWRPEYVVQIRSRRDCRVDFSGMAHIANRSGHGFPRATVKLVAGEPPRPRQRGPDRGDGPTSAEEPVNYRIDTLLDLPDNSGQQVALIPDQRDLRCTRELLFEPTARGSGQRVPQTSRNQPAGAEVVHSTLAFTLDEPISLRHGRVRVLSEDPADGTLDVLGDSELPDTPSDGRLDIIAGTADRITGQRRMDDLREDEDRLGLTERVWIRLDNQANRGTSVRVRENLWRWRDWRIVESSHPHEDRDGQSIDFVVDVPAAGQATITYSVHYRWNKDFR